MLRLQAAHRVEVMKFLYGEVSLSPALMASAHGAKDGGSYQPSAASRGLCVSILCADFQRQILCLLAR